MRLKYTPNPPIDCPKWATGNVRFVSRPIMGKNPETDSSILTHILQQQFRDGLENTFWEDVQIEDE